ncbi:PIN domain-containing protein [Candidatus Gottesmanbacteria bacterium]|nr:PIN domain-containing protein [Candidatus Gottesmanbacteria bacterium]
MVSLVRDHEISGLSSQTVLSEIKNNISKLPAYKNISEDSINKFILENNFIIREALTDLEIKPYASLVVRKDVHVIAGAILTNCDYLVTLDLKHLNNPSVKNSVAVNIVSPKNLLSYLSHQT